MQRFQRKPYISFGAVIVISFLICVVISFGADDAVRLQSTPKENVTRNTVHDISTRRNTSPKTTEVTGIKMNHAANSYINPLNKEQGTSDPNKILTKFIPETSSNSSVLMNKIVKEHREQHSDNRSNFPDEQQINTNLNLQNRKPVGKFKNVSILSDKKIVIILAYMRTGSTLTGSLLQQYPGTFYVYEPLRSVYEAYSKGDKTNATLNYINGKVRKVPVSERYQVVIDEINNWLTCRLDALSIQSLTDDFHKDHTEYMRRFYYCAKGHTSKYSRSRTDIDACLKMAIGYCVKAPLLVLKFIRLKMEEIYPILPMFPNMKIIHLVRDPRGILNSRIKVHVTLRKNYRDFMQRHCSLISDNINFTKRILEEYQERVKTVHFEDLAERPLETARSLAEFAGVQFVKPMQDFVTNQTSSSRDSCAYCTQRKDSSKTVHAWRMQLNSEYATFIDGACKSSNSILGYLPLTKSSLRDMKIPSRKNVNVYKELLRRSVE